jgi:hypothetical protein
MPSKFLTAAAACCIATSIFFSCKKEKTGHDPLTTIPKSEVFSGLKSSAQVLTVQAGMAKTIFGKDGTMLNFYPNSFKDKNGNVINNGTITIELIEMYKPGDMIANWATTTAGTQSLQSGGQIYINAYKNGQEIDVNKYGIGFKQSAPSMQAMQLFYGSNKNTDSVVTWQMADTTNPGTTAIKTYPLKDTASSQADFYLFDSCNTLKWINCDRFLSSGYVLTNVNVVFSDPNFELKTTSIFFIYPDFNSVYYANSFTSAGNLVTAKIFNAPKSQNYKVIVLVNKNGNYYYAEKSGVVTEDLSIDVAPAPETLSSIKTKLNAL